MYIRTYVRTPEATYFTGRLGLYLNIRRKFFTTKITIHTSQKFLQYVHAYTNTYVCFITCLKAIK